LNTRLQSSSLQHIWYIFVLLGVLCAFESCDNWSDRRVAETKDRGESIRRALDRYHEETGSFPVRLEDISPKYVDDIPRPTVGKKVGSMRSFNKGGRTFFRSRLNRNPNHCCRLLRSRVGHSIQNDDAGAYDAERQLYLARKRGEGAVLAFGTTGHTAGNIAPLTSPKPTR
jgi:hypothetical protein